MVEVVAFTHIEQTFCFEVRGYNANESEDRKRNEIDEWCGKNCIGVWITAPYYVDFNAYKNIHEPALIEGQYFPTTSTGMKLFWIHFVKQEDSVAFILQFVGKD